MLVIPFDRRIDWHNAPFVSITLVLINTLVFFVLQGSDERRFDEAVRYYHESGLADIEMPRYREVLKTQADLDESTQAPGAARLESIPDETLLFKMLTDAAFMERLRVGQIVTPDDPDYEDWRLYRRVFDRKMARVVWFEHALKPGAVEFSDLLTHMFLHADVMHLLGNMFFLFAVGFMVEAALGRWLYLLVYLLGGLGSAALDIALNSTSITPSIGASGAIAGLMGLYAILFGLRRVRFFIFLFVYFDYIKAPAIVLFVLWLGNEVFQQLHYAQFSNVNYLAHIGGLISGAAMALILKFGTSLVNTEYLDQPEQAPPVDPRLLRAQIEERALDFAKAAELYARMLAENPEDRALIWKLHDSARHQPDSPVYHQAAQRIFTLRDFDEATNKAVLESYINYTRSARPKPRLDKASIESLSRRFLSMGEWAQAQKLLAYMMKHAASFEALPQHLLIASQTLVRRGDQAQARQYLAYVLKHFPAAREAGLARAELKNLSARDCARRPDNS